MAWTRVSPRFFFVCIVATGFVVLACVAWQQPRYGTGFLSGAVPYRGMNLAFKHAAHPVEWLYLQAKKSHETMQKRQSTTYAEARDAYRRRYKREEPWAFDMWYGLAKAWNSTIIDDFDDTVEQLSPFKDYFAQDCDQQDLEPELLEENRLMRVCFRHKEVVITGFQEDWLVNAMHDLAYDFKDWAPNVCLLINTNDEPQLLLPPARRSLFSGSSASVTKPETCPSPIYEDKSHQSIWPDVQDYCSSYAATHAKSSDVPFVSDPNYLTDLCHVGPKFPYGGLHSPTTMKQTRDTVPILSTGTYTPFADVLFPSMFRFARTPAYYEENDVDWDSKISDIYWRGSTTGGFATKEHWQFHRQSLVLHLNSQGSQGTNVKFSDVIQCEEEACQIQSETLPMADREPPSAGLKYKMLLDIDGNGISGRLYDLLLSRSLVLRHSFIREWHDQRLRPWLHFVPLLADHGEDDQVLDYFKTPEGDKIGKLIADEGRKSAQESLRQEDMKLYFMRLVLEMGRDKEPPIH